MAPFKSVKTYQNTKKKPIPQSGQVLNLLFAANLKKRFSTSTDTSGPSNKSIDPFDLLMKGEIYNNVQFKAFPTNHLDSRDSTLGSLQSASINEKVNDKSILQSSRVNHSPVVVLERYTDNSLHSQNKNLGPVRYGSDSELGNIDTASRSNISITNRTNAQVDISMGETQNDVLAESAHRLAEKMILFDSLELGRCRNDSSFMDFKKSVNRISTPRSYSLRRRRGLPHHETNIRETKEISGSKKRKTSNVQILDLNENEAEEINQTKNFEIEGPLLPKIYSTPIPLKNSSYEDSTNDFTKSKSTPKGGLNVSHQKKITNRKKKSVLNQNQFKMKTDNKLFRKSTVILKQIPHLDELVKDMCRNSTPSNLEIFNIKEISHRFSKSQSSMKYKKSEAPQSLTRDCVVFLTSIENSSSSGRTPKRRKKYTSESMVDLLSSSDDEPLLKSNPTDHKCSLNCEHFKKQVTVLIERCVFSKNKSIAISSSNYNSPAVFKGYNSILNHNSLNEDSPGRRKSSVPRKRNLESSEDRSVSEVYIISDSEEEPLSNLVQSRAPLSLRTSERNEHKCYLGCEHFKKQLTVLVERCVFSKKESFASGKVPSFQEDFKGANSIPSNSSKPKPSINHDKKRKTESVSPIKDCSVALVAMSQILMEKTRKSSKSQKNAFQENTQSNSVSTVNIDDSRLSHNEDDDSFNGNFKIPEFIKLETGKKFRRSIAIFKKNLEEQMNNSGKIKSRRNSNKFVPVSPNKKRLTELASFAANNSGYVSLRQSSLEKVESYLPNVQPIKSYLNRHTKKFDDHLTARDIVLKRCGQTDLLNFEECYPTSALQHCQKIGEGVFGEVFMLRDKDGSTTVMKVIPIEGDQIVNLEKQKTFEEILSEIVISMELSNLSAAKRNKTDGFVKLKSVRCVRGRYPDRLLELWELYDENKQSENDSPEMFHSDQLYIVLELANAGQDLESFQFNNAVQALAVFEQVACALAVAESGLKFEHRDLHWGNVLIKPTDQKTSVFVLDGKEIVVNNRGVKATIIDFTLSRVECDAVIIFNDLALDEDLFTAKGDYQFDIYRKMREHNGNRWQSFKPFSNILWLHYLLGKAIDHFRYKNEKSKQHKASLTSLRSYEKKVLDFDSASDFANNNLID